ncbi:protoporphyrinogen/coproporphyrinogen oxidase [Leucobacter musarum]|uniref:protoporphyrinogen/coproporphyrinogen oxidase n=1 Tax=Leucobacter musarum TaxID=1930747 RepID=UPI0006A7D886|nr:FAD-dependent oxidoreductase [Leucobacter musarum]
MPTDRPRPRFAVVGGGVSGLTAARELALAGARVEVIEGAAQLGGRIRGAELGGVTIDIGAESFATRGGTVAELIREIGMSGEIVRPSGLGSWVIDGPRALPLPAAGTLGIPATPLSTATVRALGITGAVRAAIEPALPRSVGRDADSLAALVRSRLGSRVLDRLVRPVSLGVHSADPARLGVASVPGLAAAFAERGSLIAAAKPLRDSQAAAGGAVAGLRDGMTSLIAGLARELDRLGVTVRTGEKVRRIAPAPADTAATDTGSAWQIFDAEGATIATVDGVILAVPEGVARRLLADDATGTPTDRVEVVALAIDDARLDAAPRGTGALVSRDAVGSGGADGGAGSRRAPSQTGAAPILAKALTHVTAKWPERARDAGPGRHLIRLSYGRAGSAPETVGLDDAEVRSIARYDASRILGIDLRADAIVDLARCTWRMGRPPGSRDSRPLSPPPGVTLAGDWVSGTGLAAIVQGARTAAAEALAAAPGSSQ